MKKLIAMILAAAMLLSLTACGSPPADAAADDPEAETASADASAEKGVTTLDIVDAKGHDVQPLQADTVPAQLANSNPGTVAVINGNYALQADLNAAEDSLITENPDYAKVYVNVVACRSGEENSDKIQALKKALQSDDVKKYVDETYKGAVVTVF